MPTRLSPLSRGNMFCRDVWPLFRGLTGPDLSTRRNVTWKKREKINNNNNNKKKVKVYVTCGTYDLRNTWNSLLLLKIYNRVAVPVNQISRATWIGGWRGWFCAGEKIVGPWIGSIWWRKKEYLEEIFFFLRNFEENENVTNVHDKKNRDWINHKWSVVL